MEKSEQKAELRDWIQHWRRVVLVLLLGLGCLTFLGKPSAPSMIVFHRVLGLGIVESDQYKSLLDKPLLEYVARSRKSNSTNPRMEDFRKALRADEPDHSIIAQGGLNWIARSPAGEVNSKASNFQLKSKLEEARSNSIWMLDPRNWRVPVPVPTAPSHFHIARIPPRETRPKTVGHVKPDTDREAVWLRTLNLESTSPMCDVENNGPSERAGAVGGRALRLKPGESYSVGWLFVITNCQQLGGCKLATPKGVAWCPALRPRL